MGISVNKIFSNITSSAAYKNVGKTINSAVASLGEKYPNTKFANIYEKYFEPKGANNSFMVLAALMVFGVISPRVVTALKRNPDNKEATIDEIKEILFRDVQSVAVVLFMLKTLNSLIASGIGKKTGLPMTNKPYQKLFDDSLKTIGEKASDFAKAPIEKLKIIGQNILDALHPTGGVIVKSNEEFISDYSKYGFDSLPKLFDSIKKKQGRPNDVFKMIVDGTIEKYETLIKGSKKAAKAPGISDFSKMVNKDGVAPRDFSEAKVNAEATIEALKKLEDEGVESLMQKINDKSFEDESVKTAITEYLLDPENSLAQQGKGANGWLRAAALLMESSYLGFGIPALNQLRLEKKYLREHKNNPKNPFATNNSKDVSMVQHNMKAHEIKLYHEFIK